MQAFAHIDKNWILDLAEKFNKYQPIAMQLMQARVEELKQRKVLRVWYRNRWEQITANMMFFDGSDLAELPDFADVAAEARLYDMTFPNGVKLLAEQTRESVMVDDKMMRRLITIHQRVKAVQKRHSQE